MIEDTVIGLCVVGIMIIIALLLFAKSLNSRFEWIADEFNRVDRELWELKEEAIEDVIISGDDWDLVDTRTGESFLKITPDNTKLNRFGCMYLLLDIRDYLNKSLAMDNDCRKR